MDVKGIGCEGVDRTELAKDRVWWQTVVNMAMNFQVP
jgi:hypothetical protein